MAIDDILKLSYRELAAYRTRSWTTMITIGVLFGLLLAILFIMQGLENVALRYAGYETEGISYLMSSYGDYDLILERIGKYGGEIVNPMDVEEIKNDDVMPNVGVLAKFDDLKNAYQYYSKVDAKALHYNFSDYEIVELFSNQVGVYQFFREKNRSFVQTTSIVLIVASAFIMAFTLAHLITSSARTFGLYRSLGASKMQILMIYFAYLMELCAGAAVFAIILGVVLSGIATVVGWGYFLEQLSMIYPDVPRFWPILIGVNWQCFGVILSMFLTAPLAFLFCFDQFSNKKIAWRLKGD